ncbi:MAG: efflux RND transporter permease subunit [Gemmatimonadota bacterium]
MSLPRFAVKRPVTTGMIVVSTIVMGLISLNLINLDMFPSYQRPVLQVNVPYPDANPSEVERRIVRPLEENLGTVRNLETIRSTASQNRASVELEFKAGTNMDMAALEARERAELTRREMPEDVNRIDLRRFSDDEQPILRAAIRWDGDPAELSELIERRVEPTILQVPGVAAVEFNGLEEREIRVDLDQARMQGSGITLGQIRQALARGNQDFSAGEMELNGTRFMVRAEGQMSRVEELEALPLGVGDIRLADVATIVYDFPERDFFFRQDGVNARQAQIFKESDANIVEVSQGVRAALEDLEGQPGMEALGMSFWQDQSEAILDVLKLLTQSGVFGGLLAVLVLLVFLRRFTPTLIVAAAIPVSLIFTIAILYFYGASLNVITLSGLMLAVGMLIDNAVVVVENIFRHREMGSDEEEAAMEGANEVGLAIVAGTATTIIVFAPLFFMTPNQMGTQMREFGMSISFAMLASLGVAFTLIPLLAVRLIRGKMPAESRLFGYISRGYRGLLDRILDRRWAMAAVALLMFGGGAALLAGLPKELMPSEDNRFIIMSVSTPRGISIEQRDSMFRAGEEYLLANKDKFEIQTVSAFSRGTFSSIMMALVPYSEGATTPTPEISMKIERGLPVIPGVEWRQRRNFGSSGRIQVRLVGESTAELARQAEMIQWRMEREIQGLTNLDNSLQAGSEEVRVRIDRRSAERQGLTSEQVAQAVSGALRGQVATRFRTGDREIDVQLQLREDDRLSIDQLGTLAIGTPSGQNIPLNTVADLVVVGGPQDIRRENRQTSVTVTAEVAPGFLRDDLIGEVQAFMGTVDLPIGYEWDLGRGFQEEQEQFGEMVLAAGLALVLIYILLAALFESLLLPIIIYFSIFFAVPGLGLIFLLTGTSLSILSFLGILITVGIVVNNSIVMIDLVNQLRARGLERRLALLDGCQARMRPVLMTSLTTLIGLVPMAFMAGEGMGQMFAPIGQAVIGGLTTSTLLTLTLTPILYAWFDDFGLWLGAVKDRALERAFPDSSARDDLMAPAARQAGS